MNPILQKSLLLGFVALASAAPALACLNGSYAASKLRHNDVVSLNSDDLRIILGSTKPDRDELEWIDMAVRAAKGDASFDALNDLAVALVHQGKYPEAIAQLQQLELEHPGDYRVAANLGTAFELNGDNKQALEWIREGIRRNPRAHEGTEWLHVAILEAKLGQRSAGDAGHSILALDFGPRAIPSRPKNMPKGNDGKPVTLANLGLALRYQLIERTHFVKKPEPMVAALLTDWAHLELIAGDPPTASILYQKAIDYGAPLDERIMAARADARRFRTPEEWDAREVNCELCPEYYEKHKE
jgi:tetratricopeptide (TPR) repeat protein